MKKCTIIFAILSLFVWHESQAQGFLRVSGKQIVNEKGENYILRGMGLGGWMLQEPYMLQLSGATGPQYDIEAKIETLVGKENKEKFYNAWYENHTNKRDIDSLAAWGFNSIRLPMHYRLFTLPIEKEPIKGQNTWLEKGFQMTDSLLKWCAQNKMYLILDLHAAPGGQGRDANISDRDPSKPSLWESAENKQKTIELWKKLAERYANEKWIGGYDLLNEPNWNFTEGAHPNGLDEKNNQAVWDFYIELTNEIRKFDKHHIIYVEGNGWATNFTGMPQAWDKNLVINFHGYWNPNDKASIQNYLDLQQKYNLPLWMSESGENSNQWFYERTKLLEDNNIGWAWWPHKKIASVVGPLWAKTTPEYQYIINYWRNGGDDIPSADFAMKTFMQIAENLKIENCEFHPDVIDALFRQKTQNTTKPYKKHMIPCQISAVDYDMGQHEIAYKDNKYRNIGGHGSQEWNNGWIYRNDGVDIAKDAQTSEFYVSSFEQGEWIQFTVNVSETKAYNLKLLVLADAKPSQISVEFSDQKNPLLISIEKNNSWQIVEKQKVNLKKGVLSIKIKIKKGTLNLKSLEFL